MDTKTILIDLWNNRHDLQAFINHRHYDPDIQKVPRRAFLNEIKYLETDYGKFHMCDQWQTLLDATDYDMSKVKLSDIVLVLGANIGGEAIKLARTATHVYAVEPVYADRMRKNIALNKLEDKITVLEYAVGLGSLTIQYNSISKQVQGKLLSELIELCGGHVDGLNCDIEGFEWDYLTSSHLKRMRWINIEVHDFDGKHPFNDFEIRLIKAGFDVKVGNTSKYCSVMHAEKR